MDLYEVVNHLSGIPGVKAIALGGSQSRNEADEASDYDIGLYYDGVFLDTAELAGRLRELDDGRRDHLLNAPGQWGPWINGGAWLVKDGVQMDILLRDLKRVEKVIRECIEGIITIDYQCGHPFGFVNTIYAAETHYCRPLWQDGDAELERLKALLHSEGEYPPLMRDATVKKFLWEAGFSLACGRKPALKGEMNYAMGSAFRAVCSWLQVLYALNGRYLMNEKGALKRLDGLSRKPRDMEARVEKAYGLLARNAPKEAYSILDALHGELEGMSTLNSQD